MENFNLKQCNLLNQISKWKTLDWIMGKQSQKPSSSALIFAELTSNAGRLPYWWLAPLAFVVAPCCLFMTMLRYTKLLAHFASVYQASNFRQTLKPTCIHLFMHCQQTWIHTHESCRRIIHWNSLSYINYLRCAAIACVFENVSEIKLPANIRSVAWAYASQIVRSNIILVLLLNYDFRWKMVFFCAIWTHFPNENLPSSYMSAHHLYRK